MASSNSTCSLTVVSSILARIAENNYGNYLDSALKKGKYREKERTKKDIQTALQAFPGLKPTMDTFFFSNGAEKQLIALSGTLPIFYKGKSYNIPLCLWIMDIHPYRAPKIYLQPTPDMRIRTSRHVTKNGKIHLPWKKSWNPEKSSIRRLLNNLIEMFERKPPLYTI